MIKVYKEYHTFNPVTKDVFTTKVTVEDIDTLGAAQRFNTPCCLNFASHRRPGGGYKSPRFNVPKPVKTQEEDLFRRSNLPDMMDTKELRNQYPLMGTKGIYCKGIQIERDDHLRPHDPYDISLITVAAVVNPDSTDEDLVPIKVQRIFDIAHDQREEVLILGAWGCGAFKNDPQNVAALFKSFIEGEYRGVFREIVFAIPGQQSVNFQTFDRTFRVT